VRVPGLTRQPGSVHTGPPSPAEPAAARPPETVQELRKILDSVAFSDLTRNHQQLVRDPQKMFRQQPQFGELNVPNFKES